MTEINLQFFCFKYFHKIRKFFELAGIISLWLLNSTSILNVRVVPIPRGIWVWNLIVCSSIISSSLIPHFSTLLSSHRHLEQWTLPSSWFFPSISGSQNSIGIVSMCLIACIKNIPSLWFYGSSKCFQDSEVASKRQFFIRLYFLINSKI